MIASNKKRDFAKNHMSQLVPGPPKAKNEKYQSTTAPVDTKIDFGFPQQQ